jgi:hypothetical protein
MTTARDERASDDPAHLNTTQESSHAGEYVGQNQVRSRSANRCSTAACYRPSPREFLATVHNDDSVTFRHHGV